MKKITGAVVLEGTSEGSTLSKGVAVSAAVDADPTNVGIMLTRQAGLSPTGYIRGLWPSEVLRGGVSWSFGGGRHRVRLTETIFRGCVRKACLLYTSPSPRDGLLSRMPSSA